MDENSGTVMTIAVIGGTGKEGSGLALRWARAGYGVIIGSREAERAEAKAAELNEALGADVVRGMDNVSAAQAADLLVLSVPYQAHAAIVESIREAAQGKILVDVTVPLQPPAIRTVNIPEGKAASLEAQAMFGPDVRVVAAFQNISHTHLRHLDQPVDSDVLIASDDDDAKHEVAHLVEAIPGMRAIDIGPLQNAIAAEALTPVILYINKRYKAPGAGIRITGLDA